MTAPLPTPAAPQQQPRPAGQHLTAVLVMDSRAQEPSVRAQGFTGAWSRLYQAGSYFVDLTLRHDDRGAVIFGQLIATDRIAPPGGLVRLDLTHNGVTVAAALVDTTGGFRLEVSSAGEHRLECQFGPDVVAVEALEIN